MQPLTKAHLRDKVRAARARRHASHGGNDSASIAWVLADLLACESIKRVAIYAAYGSEIDIKRVAGLRPQIDFFLPKTEPKGEMRFGRVQIDSKTGDFVDVQRGRYGIVEPNIASMSAQAMDVVIVPGVAFDRFGQRLGQGKGYYDRALATFKGVSLGVCYACQVVTELVVEPHDVALKCVVVPDGVWERGLFRIVDIRGKRGE